MNRRLLLLTGFLLLALVGGLWAAESSPQPLKSGPTVGQATPMLPAIAVNGPYKGRKTCYTRAYKGAPTVYLFVRDATEQAAELVIRLDKLVQQHGKQGLKAVVVLLAGAETKPLVSTWAQQKGIQVPIAYPEKGRTDPALKPWNINPQAATTLVIARGGKVTFNLVNVRREDEAKVAQAVQRVLAKAKSER